MGIVLLVIVILVLLFVIPVWPYSRTWGPAPGGIVGLLLVILVVLLLLGML